MVVNARMATLVSSCCDAAICFVLDNHDRCARLIDAMDLKMFLARSSPIVVISPHGWLPLL